SKVAYRDGPTLIGIVIYRAQRQMSAHHRGTALRLYRRLMRLHRRLPDVDMAQIGRQFVREEFHRHKTADPKFVTSFMKEWTDYAEVLEGQLEPVDSDGSGEDIVVLGRNFSSVELDLMSGQQLGQLMELKGIGWRQELQLMAPPAVHSTLVGFYVQPDVLFSLGAAGFSRGVRVSEVSGTGFLRSTLFVPRATHGHTGTYHCNIEDGTDRVTQRRAPGLCWKLPCLPFITASHPATITVLGNSTVEEAVEIQSCSSVLLRCGSLLSTHGLRPVLEWVWDGITLNISSNWYAILANGDLVLYDELEDNEGSGVRGQFQCIALSEDHSNPAVIASYTVDGGAEGSGDPSSVLQLDVSPASPVTEGESFSIYLNFSAGHCQGGQPLHCGWTRNGSSLCSHDNERYGCGVQVLTVKSTLDVSDSGRYCCLLDIDSVETTHCIDIGVRPKSTPMGTSEKTDFLPSDPPLVSSPHNGTTLTTVHPSPLTLACSPSPPTSSLFWLFNGVARPDWNGLTEISLETLSIGVYQCFAGNQFGYSVVTLRILPDGLTNPPGIPNYLYEVPRPDSLHRPAYYFSWEPPTYPQLLDTATRDLYYSLSTIPATLTRNSSTVAFIGHDTYASLFTFVVDENGVKLSEGSPAFWRKFNDSRCYKLVYFPPLLNVGCDGGQANLTWTNNPENTRIYYLTFYNLNEHIPGRYYIHITCYLQNNILIEVEHDYSENGSSVFEELEKLPVGSECVFRGAATPPDREQWPSFCLDPANVVYSTTSCHTTAYVEFERGSYQANEGERFKEVCVTSRGSNFSLQLLATHEDNSTEVREVEVTAAGSSVCVDVDLRNDEVVNKPRNISLSLRTSNVSISTGPSAIITTLNDDIARVYFTKQSYSLEEGNTTEICVETDMELPITVYLSPYTNRNSSGRLDLPQEFALGPLATISCQPVTSHDNDVVDESQTYQLMLLDGGNPLVSTTGATLTIANNDVVNVGFTGTQYEVEAGEKVEVCVIAEATWRLEKVISVDLILFAGSTGNERAVELSKETLEFSTSNTTSCVSLNTSSGISSTATFELKLVNSRAKDIRYFNNTAYITVMGTVSSSHKQDHTEVILASVMPFILVFVTAILIFLLLLRRRYYNHRGLYTTHNKFHQESLEYCDYEPKPISFGSSSTVYDSVTKPAPDSDVRKDLDIESLTDSCDQPLFFYDGETFQGGREGKEKVEEEEEEGNMARERLCYRDKDDTYPPSMTGNIGSGGGWQRHHSTVAEMTPQEDRETETTTDTITLGERPENGATDCKSTGRGFGTTATAAGTDAESLGVFGDLTAGFRNLLSEVADLAVGDSVGIIRCAYVTRSHNLSWSSPQTLQARRLKNNFHDNMAVMCCSSLLALSLGVLLAAWWLAGRDVPAGYDRPPVTNADGSVYFDHTNLLMPSTVEEIAEIVQSANRDGRSIKVLGAGHSRSAIAHSNDIYLSLYNYRGVVNIDRPTKRVAVKAGTLLKHLNKQLRRNGLGLSNLPTLGDQTIGGALAVAIFNREPWNWSELRELGNISDSSLLRLGHWEGKWAQMPPSFAFYLTFVTYLTLQLISVNASSDPNLFKAALVSLGMIGVVTEVTFQCEEAHNLRENITVLPVDHCLRNLPLYSSQSDHGKFWIEAHSGVCAMFSVWKTNQPVTEVQGVWSWDVKNRISEPLLWLGSWLPSVNPRIVSFLYNSLQIFTPYERIDASEHVLIPPLYVPANHQLEFGVDMKDCVAAVNETVHLARSNPHTNMFTEVRYVKRDEIFLSPNYQRDSCQVTVIIYNPSHDVLHGYFDALCESFSRYSARPHWAKHLCGLRRSQLEILYPKLSDFAKIRADMDPNGVFINNPLRDLFSF
ncbi:L-gulonolactone oxidase, partial [Geodia barretti]